ncbi:aprataxin and PNK-like factor isoform X2 [Wyeomyia smithii]|uniref:aprataxin and PNK-like factor isoform X2 n=1 Tax=Wyeomyia smithii TaxID=174621 RepID=UPI002467B848|nr:aprataxin and PNK-like factor isoform X2 [Wyeomyia smithii]
MNQFYLYDCEKQVDIPIPNAETVIGRDSILQCNDKRISRQHGIIKPSDGEASCVQITSTHSNPIFIRTEDNVLNILTKDLTATLRQGEKFALLPDQFWFEVRFRRSTDQEQQQETAVSSSSANIGVIRIRTMDEVNNTVETSNGEAVPVDRLTESGDKRKNVEPNSESAKKSKTDHAVSSEVTARDETCSTTKNAPESAPQVASSNDPVIKPDPDAAEASSSKTSEAEANVKTGVKKENADSTGPPPRPSCEFGIRCYRHNVQHRAQFAHPNDSDYRRPTFAPAPDDAPHCPFGASCYRRNPVHFREYQHPDSTSVTPITTQVPVQQQQPLLNNNGIQQVRRRRRMMRDVLMAAIVNPLLFAGSDDEDDDGDLFEYDSDSDEYRPGRESSGDDDDEDEPEIDTYEAEE